jgi:Ca2+-binding EF-hand superfamily protein
MQRARGEIIVKDLLKQKKCLMMSFVCLDMDKDGLVDLAVFKAMMDRAFNKRLTEKNIGRIYLSVAGELNKKLNIEKFANLANTMQNLGFLFKKEPLEIWLWEK